MKRTIQMMAFAAIATLSMSSCRTRMTGGGTSAAELIDSYTGSYNEVNLDIATEPITYSIDISTAEGRTKLRKLSLRDAKSLAIREAVMMNRCAKIVNPQYTQLMKGKKVLRITVYGFPAVYKNKPETPYDSRTRQEIDINVKQR